MSLTGKPALTSAAIIANDGFWPDLALSDLMSQYRIPSEYADETIKTGLTMAIIRTNEQLFAVKQGFLALAYATLEDYTDAHPDDINDTPVLLWHYQHAVFCLAKAMLLQQFNSLNRKPEAENAAKEAPETEAYWLNEAQRSLNSLFAVILPTQSQPGKAGFHVALL